MVPTRLSRRAALLGAAGGLAAAWTPAPTRALTVHRTPTCGCCASWVAHMRAAGFTARVVEHQDLAPVRARLGVPDALAACHTGEIGGYAIEGHVPAADVVRLLDLRPNAVGLSVPGMPLGSPGMEVPGRAAEPFETLLIGRDGRARVFARHDGSDGADR